MSLHERDEIREELERGDSLTAVAAVIGRAVSAVSREVAANGGRGDYRAWRAHRRTAERARRPKTPPLAHRPLAARVTAWLKEWWSSEEDPAVADRGTRRSDDVGEPTRRSTRRSSSTAAVSCAGNCIAACAQDAPNGGLAAGSRHAAPSPTRS
ncbi:MAG: helix-turn-helix domain-containing protein [Acidimicrobiales bacterium]